VPVERSHKMVPSENGRGTLINCKDESSCGLNGSDSCAAAISDAPNACISAFMLLTPGLDNASATMLLGPVTCFKSVVNSAMKERCRSWRGENFSECEEIAYVSGL